MSPSRSIIGNRISLASGAGDSRSPLGLVGAVLLHAAIIAATLFSFEHRLDIAQESPPVVPVDLVTIGAKTNITPTVRPQRRVAAEPVVQPKPEPHLAPEPIVPPKPQPLEFHAPKIAMEKSEPAPQQETPPQPASKPQPKKSSADNFQALLNKLSTSSSSQPANARIAQQTRKGFGAQDAMTMDLRDSLKNQIEQCWNPPAGAPHPEQLVVFVDLRLNPDGSVAGKPQLAAQSLTAVAGNPFIRAAADAAMRAIYVCAPYKLPAERFSDWRDSTVEFDPRDLAGQ
ncbi:MAG TPA: hypothetical protein VN154_04660 [Rhizomicrobium sp.]|nr:hypothetical protein [Rhizomicrobium sp.]